MKPYVLGAIFARGGSKGVPRKNVRPLAGKPLIAYAIQTALASEWVSRLIVSTEDQEIADVARRYGAEVPFLRPAGLAGDSSPEWLAWQHALRAVQTNGSAPKIDIFVCIPPTSPLRTVEDVNACIRALWESSADLVMTVKPAQRNPFYNMVTLDRAGYARLAMQSGEVIQRRQDAPPVYDIATLAYAARPEFVLRANHAFEGKVRAVVVPAERAVDIDTETDFRFAEFLLSQLPSNHS